VYQDGETCWLPQKGGGRGTSSLPMRLGCGLRHMTIKRALDLFWKRAKPSLGFSHLFTLSMKLRQVKARIFLILSYEPVQAFDIAIKSDPGIYDLSNQTFSLDIEGERGEVSGLNPSRIVQQHSRFTQI
jgi:hypothetical protein